MSLNKGIGWDIGIKNLAYCSINKLDSTKQNTTNKQVTDSTITFNTHQYEICNWADISLVDEIEKNLENAGQVSLLNNDLKCCASNPKAKITDANQNCGKAAFYCKEELGTDGTYQGLCKNHFKKLGYTRLPEINVKKCWSTGCTGKPSQVDKKHIYKGYCKKHINEMVKEANHISSDFLKINRAKNTSKIDINHLGMGLFQSLDKIKQIITDNQIILLENQPVLKNPTMKSMQMFLYSYYLMQFMKDGGIGDKKLQCYCASKKLDLIKFLPAGEQTRIGGLIDKINGQYQKNKKLSIYMVEYLLKDNKKWQEFFNSHPKKDDLADSLLMTLHYFERDNLAKLKKDEKKAEEKEKKGKGKNKKVSDKDDECEAEECDDIDNDI